MDKERTARNRTPANSAVSKNGTRGGPAGSTARRRWLRRLAIGSLLILVSGVLAGEAVARFVFGLGDPPLFQCDPDPNLLYIEQPSKSYYRMHHRFSVNAYSMRSADFPAKRVSPSEIRVMVIGDSVVNGNSPVGDEQLATTLLQANLAAQSGRPVIVGNCACGGWGPGNELAYVQRYGLFDADVVVIVMSSHDYADLSTACPVDADPNFPSHPPLCAFQEALTRYLPRYLPHGHPTAGLAGTVPDARAAANHVVIDQCVQRRED